MREDFLAAGEPPRHWRCKTFVDQPRKCLVTLAGWQTWGADPRVAVSSSHVAALIRSMATSCRQPRYLARDVGSRETGGFASPPHDGFALESGCSKPGCASTSKASVSTDKLVHSCHAGFTVQCDACRTRRGVRNLVTARYSVTN